LKINSRKFSVEQNFLIRYDNVVKIFQDIEKKCSIKSEKIDTHLDIVFNIVLRLPPLITEQLPNIVFTHPPPIVEVIPLTILP
jgi:hypothetical protein